MVKTALINIVKLQLNQMATCNVKDTYKDIYSNSLAGKERQTSYKVTDITQVKTKSTEAESDHSYLVGKQGYFLIKTTTKTRGIFFMILSSNIGFII